MSRGYRNNTNNDREHAESMKDFEKSRIEKLQEERELVQKKTFTKWCNSFLSKHEMEITNLFKDLEDGKRLIKLLEAISGKKLGKPNQGKMKVHKIENVNMAIGFIQMQLQAIGAKLESIGAEDIVDGNRTLILGLIWTIILRFQISEISEEDDKERKDGKNSKEILLLWCQRRVAGYPGVRVVDFTHSWRDGKAFNALVHSQRPDLFDYNDINASNNNQNNLNHAFDVAEKKLGISRILDAEDIDVDKPDEKLVLTYVSTIYHTFAKMKTEVVGGKRIGKIVTLLIDIDKMKELYEKQVIELIMWINRNVGDLNDSVFPNSLDGIKKLMLTFNKGYMTLEKPPKYKEKGLLEANFYNINMKLNAQGHPKYIPAEGKSINDLEMAWIRLEKTEHERDLALKRELNRQEQLEQMYSKFDKKAKLREDWLNEMSKILTEASINLDTSQIDAVFRKHEAIGADINAREERFNRLDLLAKTLVKEDYFSKETVNKRNQQIQFAYNNLLTQFDQRKTNLASYQELALLFQEIESLKNEMLELDSSFQSKEYGECLLAVEDLITKHSLSESQIAGINQHLKSVNRRAQQFTRNSITPTASPKTPTTIIDNTTGNKSVVVYSESQLVKEKLDALNKALDLINKLAGERRKYLEERREYHKFMEEADEEIMWLREKFQIVQSNELGHDLGSIQILINKHEQLEDEIKFRYSRIEKISASVQIMIGSGRFNDVENLKLTNKCNELQGEYSRLKNAAGTRRSLLEDSYTLQQYYVDANETDSWIKDKLALVSLNSDCGKDEASSQALLKRHARIQEEINTYGVELKRLTEISDVLVGKTRFSAIPADIKQKFMKNQAKRNQINSDTNDSDSPSVSESDSDDSSSSESDTAERTREVPCVKALFPYQSNTFNMAKEEILELINKTNQDWWLVKKLDPNGTGHEGYAPANYLKEIAPQRVHKEASRKKNEKPEILKAGKSPLSIEAIQNESKYFLNKQQQQQRLQNPKRASILRRKTTSIKPRQLQHLSTENLKKRQVEIVDSYRRLLLASTERHKQLDNTITFYKWHRKHDELGRWIRDKIQQINVDKNTNNHSNISILENPDSAKRLYQAFITDYLAVQNEFGQLDSLAADLAPKKLAFNVANETITSETIERKQRELNAEYAKLLALKNYWDNSIKAIQCIDQFNSLYVEINDLMKEKQHAVENDFFYNDVSDVKTVRALQNKQDKLEREVGPLEKNVADLHKVAAEVCKYFPQEQTAVKRKMDLIDQHLHKLKEDVKTRKARLDEKHGVQRFENEADDFLSKCASVKLYLNELESPCDLKQCEDMEKKHSDLKQEFTNELMYKYDSLKELSQTLMKKSNVKDENLEKINAKLLTATAEKEDMAKLVAYKQQYLTDCLKYLKFKQDASNLELIMQDQETYLHYDDIGSSSSNVDALQKHHDEFMAKLMAQEEKAKNLNDQLVKLEQLPFRREVEEIYSNLVKRRQLLKMAAQERKQKLQQSKNFYEFKIECDDLNSWINERRKMIAQLVDSIQEPASSQLEKIFTKYETIEKELASNRTRLEKLKADGGELSLQLPKEQQKATPYPNSISAEEVRHQVMTVEQNWRELEAEIEFNGVKLNETKFKADLNKSLTDIDARMKSISKELMATNYALTVGSDLRSTKDLIKRYQDLKSQIRVEMDLVHDLPRNKHSAQLIDEYLNRFEQLEPELESKQKDLEHELNLKQLLFDVDEQIRWIGQTMNQVELMTNTLPQTLFEATNLNKKLHELDRSLTNNHKPIIDKLLNQGKLVVMEGDQPGKSKLIDELGERLGQLEKDWLSLLNIVDDRKILINKCLQEQKLLDELNQINLSLSEKRPIFENNDVVQVQDDIVLNKHLVKLNQLKDDLKGYKDVLQEISKTQKENKNLQTAQVDKKYNETHQNLNEMDEKIEERKKLIKLQLEALEFYRESSELIIWLNEKRQQAQSEEFGQDLEHLNLIKAKFGQLKEEIRSSEPKYQRLRKLASDILSSKLAESKPIRKREDDLKNTRELLENDIQNREQVLESAGEIHKFNKDVQDLLRCINEKELAFVNDLGKDFNSCELLQRRHQIYVEELTALRVQLHELNKQSEMLRNKHPGDTAEGISAEIDDLVDRFRKLWLTSERRTKDLRQASDYFRFLVCIRDVNEWMDETRRVLTAQVNFNDLFSVTNAQQEHENLSYEMSQRDDLFKCLEEMSIQLATKQNHPNKTDIIHRTNSAMIYRENLFRLWDLKNKLLLSQYDCHEFYRDCTQIISSINQMDLIISKALKELQDQLDAEQLIAVEDLENLAKTNENFKKKIEKQTTEKVNDLQKKAAVLTESERVRTSAVENNELNLCSVNEISRLENTTCLILKRQNDLNELSIKRTKQLNEALNFFRLKRDVDEFVLWIEDRIRYAQKFTLKPEKSLSFNEKVKLFQRQKALTTEIEANQPRLNDLTKRCKEQLSTNRTVQQAVMKTTYEELNKLWQQLAYELKERAKEFEEAKDIFEFNDQLEQLEEWLKDKELMIQNGDTGRDYEHCVNLLKKADEAISPLYEQKFATVIAMGDKLTKQGRTDASAQKNRLLDRFSKLKKDVENYKRKLKQALEKHSFIRDYDDLSQRIREKITMLAAEPDSKSLESVQIAQSKLIELEHDLKAISVKLDKLNADSRILNDPQIDEKMKTLGEEWSYLNQLVDDRKLKLAYLYDLHKFLIEYNNLKSWINDMNNYIDQQFEPANLNEAEQAINLHAERLTEIDGKMHRFISVQKMANQLLDRRETPAALNHQPEINKCVKDLTDSQSQLEAKSKERQKWLQECAEYQNLKEYWQQIENWSRNIEHTLLLTDMGDSLPAVKSLLNKQENIESTVKSQMAPQAAFDTLEQRATEMIKQNHSKSTSIQTLLHESQTKRKLLEQLTSTRRRQLEYSLVFQNFLLSYYETIQWVKEKTASAMDKNYMDLLNLQTKIQRHQTFLLDIKKSGTKRVDDLHREADVLILDKHHQHSQLDADIKEYLSDLDAQWNALNSAGELKRKRLDNAYKFVQFRRQCEDLTGWFDEIEAQLANDNNGHDLISCKMLLVRHENLVRQIELQKDKLNDLEQQLTDSRENFMFTKMQEIFNDTKQRYLNLQEPCFIRRENLEESLVLFNVLHEWDDLMHWINEKAQSINQIDATLTTLVEINKQLNKTSQLKEEIEQQQPIVNQLIRTIKNLIERKHYSYAQLTGNLTELESKWKQLDELLDDKFSKLKEELKIQKYYAEVDEVIEWLKDKQPEVVNTEFGKNDLQTMTYLKKIQSLLNDLKTNKKPKVNILSQLANTFDKKPVQRRQTELELFLNRLIEKGEERESQLKSMLKVFEFDRQCEEMVNWIKDQNVIASSQDFGTDLEHAESLLKKFLEFQNELVKNNESINKLDEMAQQLCENKHTPAMYIEIIDYKCSNLNKMWSELLTLTEIRRQTLESAIEVHAFDKDCDDLINWTVEKERLISQEDIGYDLASVYTIGKQQEALEQELTALSEELERLHSESNRLSKQYPETKDHIDTRLDDAQSSYNDLLKEISVCKEKIHLSKDMFLFLNEYNELSEWFREMLVKITSADIGYNSSASFCEVNTAELLIKRHKEFKIEIDLQQAKIQKFLSKSDDLLERTRTNRRNQLNQNELRSKKEAILAAQKNLSETWQSRQQLYEQNLEYNKLTRELKLLDTWLSSKDSIVNAHRLGDTISQVDALIKEHDDFEIMLKAMEFRFENLKKENKLEKMLRELKQKEDANRQLADAQFEEEKKKDAERKKKLEQRRQDDRRRTQEIISYAVSSEQSIQSVPPPTVNEIAANLGNSVGSTIENGSTTTFIGTGVTKIKNKKDRNRTRSIRDKYKIPLRLPPPSVQDYLMRKQEFQKGGQRAPIREYQPFYTTIHSNLMCFFLNEKDYNELNAASHPINLYGCKLNKLEDTTIQRDVIHLETVDGAEYLFDPTGDENNIQNFNLWLEKLNEASVANNLEYGDAQLSLPNTSIANKEIKVFRHDSSQSINNSVPVQNDKTVTRRIGSALENVGQIEPEKRRSLVPIIKKSTEYTMGSGVSPRSSLLTISNTFDPLAKVNHSSPASPSTPVSPASPNNQHLTNSPVTIPIKRTETLPREQNDLKKTTQHNHQNEPNNVVLKPIMEHSKTASIDRYPSLDNPNSASFNEYDYERDNLNSSLNSSMSESTSKSYVKENKNQTHKKKNILDLFKVKKNKK